MGILKIGLQLYSVRDFMEKDFFDTLEKVKAMGYDAVEFACGFFGHTGKEVKAKCDELGLEPLSAHVDRKGLLKDGTIANYADAGCKYIALPWSDWKVDLAGAEGYEAFKKDIETISIACKKYGITLLYHNHDFEFEKVDGKYKLDHLYDDIPSDILQTEIDTCWARVGGENPAEYILKYSGRAPIVHFKDYVGKRSSGMYELIGGGKVHKIEGVPTTPFEFRPVGYGVQNVKELLAAAEKAGAEAVIVEQDKPSMDRTSLECAEMSVNYIKSLYSKESVTNGRKHS